MRRAGRDAEQHQPAGCGDLAPPGARLRAKPASSRITWSDGITTRMPAGSVRSTSRAATAMAGAVLRATGSSRMARGIDARPLGLVPHQEAMVVVADDDGAAKPALRGSGALSVAARKLAVWSLGEADELLGVHGPRQRPQPRARAPGQNHRMNDRHTIAASRRSEPLAARRAALKKRPAVSRIGRRDCRFSAAAVARGSSGGYRLRPAGPVQQRGGVLPHPRAGAARYCGRRRASAWAGLGRG